MHNKSFFFCNFIWSKTFFLSDLALKVHSTDVCVKMAEKFHFFAFFVSLGDKFFNCGG